MKSRNLAIIATILYVGCLVLHYREPVSLLPTDTNADLPSPLEASASIRLTRPPWVSGNTHAVLMTGAPFRRTSRS
jgi:hypothetical protein